jgi:hypothetical protein
MGPKFWLKRFLLAFATATVLLAVIEVIKGRGTDDAAEFALQWGAISAALFTAIGYIRFKRNPTCWRPPPDVKETE